MEQRGRSRWQTFGSRNAGKCLEMRQTETLQTRGFCTLNSLHFVERAQVWNRLWNSRTKDAAPARGVAISLSAQATSSRLRRLAGHPLPSTAFI
jgi:hypothetical protein